MKSEPREPLLLIAGATASGKSALALRVASECGGEIVSLDSVQIYRGADIGSAKPAPHDRVQVAHHLIDIRDPDERYSAAQFVRDCEASVAEIKTRSHRPIIVGGATLYLTSLLHGLADLVRGSEALRGRLSSLSDEEIYVQLLAQDPQSARRLHPNDRFRVSRALENVIESGSSTSRARAEHGFAVLRNTALIIVLCPPREELYRRIDARADRMLCGGLIEETAKLRSSFGDDVALFKTLGYQECLSFLKGELPRERLAAEIAMHTRRYAKRQMTYWRNEPRKRGWKVIPPDGAESLLPVYKKKQANGREGSDVSAGGNAAVTADVLTIRAIEERLAQVGNEVVVWYVGA